MEVNAERLTSSKAIVWQRQLIVGLIPLTAGVCILASIVFVPRALRGNADFRQFYAGGYMLRNGLRHQLYEPAVQKQVEDRVVSQLSGVLPVNHPAYEYLFFVPLTLMSYPHAYLAWGCINLLVLVVCGIRLSRHIRDTWLSVALITGYAPLWATIMHGQDSMWLLLLSILSFESTEELAAGALMGMTAFRFHLLIPVIVLYVLWKRWRFVQGILISGFALAALSSLIVGVDESFLYARSAAATTAVHNGLPANLYGLIQAMLGPQHSLLATFVAVLCAAISLAYASRQEPTLTSALLVVPLVSYYLMPHDLTVLLIPISLLLRENWAAVLQFFMPLFGFTPFAFVSAAPSALMLFGRQQTRNASN